MEFNFEATKFERAWTQEALADFHADGWFTEVLYRVKGGKEANVYCCRADPDEVGYPLVAAKVYRHRGQRSMKNYSAYRTGRTQTRDKRLLRAIKKKSRTGKETEDSAWIDHEFGTMEQLWAVGADVPKPLTTGPNAIIMEYIGNEDYAAPLLQEIDLEPGEAGPLFEALIANVERLLACDLVHGDLSPFNVLYWEGRVTLIDFPQAVDPMGNPNAFSMLVRDLERVCQYFGRFGVETHGMRLAEDLWKRYMKGGFRGVFSGA